MYQYERLDLSAVREQLMKCAQSEITENRFASLLGKRNEETMVEWKFHMKKCNTSFRRRNDARSLRLFEQEVLSSKDKLLFFRLFDVGIHPRRVHSGDVIKV